MWDFWMFLLFLLIFCCCLDWFLDLRVEFLPFSLTVLDGAGITSAGFVPTRIHSRQHRFNKLSNSSIVFIVSNFLIHKFLNLVALLSLSPSLICSKDERVETNESSVSCSLDGRSVDVSSDHEFESDPLSCESEFKLESPDVGGEEGGDSLLVVIAGGGDDMTKVGGGVTIGEDSTYDTTLSDIELLILILLLFES